MLVHGVELIERDDMVCLSQRNHGYFEPISIAAWSKHCIGTVIDIGAYTGLYSILAAKQGAEVYALEPNSLVYSRLLQNIEANGVQVSAINTAAGQLVGDCTMHTEGRPRLTSAGYVTQGGSTPMVSVDSMHLDNVTAIKIDAEGYEISILKGSVVTLGKYMPIVIAEALTGYDANELDSFMFSLGYSVTPADDRNRIYAKATA